MHLASIETAIRAHGLEPRGAFHALPADGVTGIAHGTARTVVLAGNIGGSLWPAFSAAPEYGRVPHALDAWTRRVATAIAGEVGADVVFPFDGPPHHPFQRWAQRADAVHASPIGLLIHPEHGLWHAYRAAFVFADLIDIPQAPPRPSPCTTCSAKPCLSACPVGAFSSGSYDVASCAAHVGSPRGADCRDHGCRARRACPIGQTETYGDAQHHFHMDAFLASRN